MKAKLVALALLAALALSSGLAVDTALANDRESNRLTDPYAESKKIAKEIQQGRELAEDIMAGKYTEEELRELRKTLSNRIIIFLPGDPLPPPPPPEGEVYTQCVFINLGHVPTLNALGVNFTYYGLGDSTIDSLTLSYGINRTMCVLGNNATVKGGKDIASAPPIWTQKLVYRSE